MITKQKVLAVIIFGFSLGFNNLTFAQQTPWPTTDSISPSTAPSPTPPTAGPPKEKDEEKFKYNKFGIGLFYNFADTPKLKGTGTSASKGTLSGEAEFESEGAPGLYFYGDSRFNNRWGMEYGVGYEFERKIKSIQFKDYLMEDPKIAMTIFYFQLNGKFFATDNFYILFGINLNRMDLKDSVIDLDMGGGGQLGLGFQISHNFAFEAQYQTFYSNYKGKFVVEMEDGDIVTITGNGFSLEGVKVIFRYSF